MSERGIIVVISGPSGTGKGTLLEEAMRRNKNLKYSVSATTRKPRPGEIPEESYFFRSREEFDEMIASGEILEWDEFCTNRYGTPRTPLENSISRGEDVVMDITFPGAMAVKRAFPEDAVTVFILPPSEEELERRLRGRKTESEEEIARRLHAAKLELTKVNLFDYSIVNDDLQRAASELLEIVETEKKNRTVRKKI